MSIRDVGFGPFRGLRKFAFRSWDEGFSGTLRTG